ncbi:TPA: type II toxin-antitoxin system HipA family toxin [Pseudomonas aeruginosa]|uniref:type II toxin-antitoxin system HipA family toxin n=1 Tax=Pseudomonas aeruginosa TaxID=287 RepID=UPI000EB5F385|nr:type II toxin-antitoxin system HipA family toxin [Pseudomonas aeruginosa]MBI8222892.1 type II toxin-antitoxin system HipA family toxin [Pseudomonas aeruginosa]MDP5707984.1 type II toxin-antitoxin system HipA family toxin [Pseudomonas aeruginosa]HBO0349166.1 type II toxin-antitoxin system HipA family toxin [Pseudomonas aeruginosa]HCF2186020.1 type II toxin-antitoxin system HipA family toxin [Pseudomonas aeruginosa]HCW0993892.1 type II toxin-antitoxin system HipA family toxin [Pseudomonas aer
MKTINTVEVLLAGIPVGELVASRQGIYFAYHPQWLAQGFNLSPLNMDFTTQPQKAADPVLFAGLPGALADSLPDGWGMLLMDRYFLAKHGKDRRDISPLDRLAYMADRGMGALEYRPVLEHTTDEGEFDLAQLYQESQAVYEGETSSILDALRLAGGSPAGARPKVVVALSPDRRQCSTSFQQLPTGYQHWLVKFRAPTEHRDTGAIEYAYALMAERAGVKMAASNLLTVNSSTGTERFFAAQRFDRHGNSKIHMMTASGILYADYRAPSLDYSDLLKTTNAVTNHAAEVERMARLMVFNALTHNHDDHAKNFAFLHDQGRWVLAPAYDLTYAPVRGYADEHTTSFNGAGLATRKKLKQVCAPFRYLNPDLYVEQTLDALSGWPSLCGELEIAPDQQKVIQRAFDEIRNRLG